VCSGLHIWHRWTNKSLKGATLRGLDLHDGHLQNCDLTGVDLEGTDLEGADMRWLSSLSLSHTHTHALSLDTNSQPNFDLDQTMECSLFCHTLNTLFFVRDAQFDIVTATTKGWLRGARLGAVQWNGMDLEGAVLTG